MEGSALIAADCGPMSFKGAEALQKLGMLLAWMERCRELWGPSRAVVGIHS